jgi:hypothetical protein
METSVSLARSKASIGSTEKRIDCLCILGLYFASLAPRLVAIIYPPAIFYYNFDERDIVFSALDRFFGIPPVSIMEPATIVQFLSLPFYALDMVIRLGVPRHPAECLEKIALYLSVVTRDPRHVITVTRVLVALLCSLAPVFVYQIARRRLRTSTVVAIICGLVVAVHPMFFFQSVMAAGDSVAITFVLFSLSVLMRDQSADSTRVAWSAVLFAAAVASKITAASSIVLPLLFILREPLISLSRRIRLILLFGAAALAAFFAFMPFAWTDPLRFCKAVFGTINKSASGPNIRALYILFVDAHGMILLFGIAVAVVAAVPIIRSQWPKQGRYAAAAIITLLIVTAPIGFRATTAYSRYLLPTIPAIVILFASIGSAIVTRRTLNRVATGILAVIVVAMSWKECRVQIRLRRANDLVGALHATPSITRITTMFIPVSSVDLAIIEMPQSFWLRMAHRAAEMEKGQGIRSFVELHGLSQSVSDVLVTVFNEDEQSNLRHATAAAMTAPNLSYDVFVYDDRQAQTITRQPQIDMTLEEAMRDVYSAGKTTAILVRHADPTLGNPHWRGRAEWFWYLVGQH